MIKINKFSLGKGVMKNRYEGISITISLWLFKIKIERIGFKKYFLWRMEFLFWKD